MTHELFEVDSTVKHLMLLRHPICRCEQRGGLISLLWKDSMAPFRVGKNVCWIRQTSAWTMNWQGLVSCHGKFIFEWLQQTFPQGIHSYWYVHGF